MCYKYDKQETGSDFQSGDKQNTKYNDFEPCPDCPKVKFKERDTHQSKKNGKYYQVINGVWSEITQLQFNYINSASIYDNIHSTDSELYKISTPIVSKPSMIKGEHILITITSSDLTKKFFDKKNAEGADAALKWLKTHKDSDYPDGFINSEFQKDGKPHKEGYDWFNDQRAQNLDLKNKVVSIDEQGRSESKGIMIMGIENEEFTTDTASWVYLFIPPVKDKSTVIETPDGQKYRISYSIEGRVKGKINILLAAGLDNWAKVYTGLQLEGSFKGSYDSEKGFNSEGSYTSSSVTGGDFALMNQEMKIPFPQFSSGNSSLDPSYKNSTDVMKWFDIENEIDKLGKNNPLNKTPKPSIATEIKVIGKKTSFSVSVDAKSKLIELDSPPLLGVLRIEVNGSGQAGFMINGTIEKISSETKALD